MPTECRNSVNEPFMGQFWLWINSSCVASRPPDACASILRSSEQLLFLELLRRARKDAGLTQQVLAAKRDDRNPSSPNIVGRDFTFRVRRGAAAKAGRNARERPQKVARRTAALCRLDGRRRRAAETARPRHRRRAGDLRRRSRGPGGSCPGSQQGAVRRSHTARSVRRHDPRAFRRATRGPRAELPRPGLRVVGGTRLPALWASTMLYIAMKIAS